MVNSRSVIAMLAASTVLASAPAYAQDTVHYEIAGQVLGDALRAYGIAAKQQIIFSEGQVRGKHSTALRGNFTLDQGLAQLLAGTGLTTSRTSSGIIYIVGGSTSAIKDQVTIASKDTSDQLGEPSTGQQSNDIVVTGSRIKQAVNETAAPQVSFTRDAITERGFTQVGDFLNLITANAPEFQIAPSYPPVVVTAGRQVPNLFNLGSGRTLSLINGRRTVSSSSGIFGGGVDTNSIPVDLIDRVDVIEAGGAAVYGSDAIAGVVNYVLKRSFQGLSADAQSGISSRGDYSQPSLRLTAGKNFSDGKGNITVSAEYSSTSALLFAARPYSAAGQGSVPNTADTGPTDGISATRDIFNETFYQFNDQGIVYRSPFDAGYPNFSTDNSRLVKLNGSPLQFAADGQSVVPYNLGTIQSTSAGIASGGDGKSSIDRRTLYGGTRRWSTTALAHYDFSNAFRLSGEFSYGHQVGTDPLGGGVVYKILPTYPLSSSYALFFNKTNPFLTASDVATLSAASPGFASGGSVLLSKVFENILPSQERRSDTSTWRSVLSLDGDFTVAGKGLYYNLSYNHGETRAQGSSWDQNTNHLNNALNAKRNTAGQIVCAINADAITTNDDPSCVPINPFSTMPVSQAAQNYVSVLVGTHTVNLFDDFVASLGGNLVKLPGGDLRFSVAYEHRRESARDTPSTAELLGLPYGQTSSPEGGSFHTDEYSAEAILPVIGRDFTLPLVKTLEFNGSYRHVDNSLAGKENVWGVGGRWEIGGGLTLRGTISRNFRAPTLDELISPNQSTPQAIFYDPCSFSHINGGSAPSRRLANCQSQFAANPQWGPLANFFDSNENVQTTLVTTGGNPNLRNEVSRTKTFGAVWEPKYIPGLSVAIDVISVNLTDALVQFSPVSFFVKCYDTSPQDATACSSFTRNATNGFISTALSTYTNAGYIKYRGETYKLNYALALDRVSASTSGVVRFGFEATHTSKYEESDTGLATNAVHSEGTVANPDWRMRFDLNYDRGPFSFFYSFSYYPSQKSSYYDTIETTPDYRVAATSVSSASVSYRFNKLSLRAGVTNIFDQAPSYPTFTYGDPLGRRFFVGANVRF